MTIFKTIFLFLLLSNVAHAVIGDAGAGWAQVPYLYRILAENIKRYQQLRLLIRSVENNHEYVKLINWGIDNSVGLLNSLPIKDENILRELNDFNRAHKSITELYGKIPQGSDKSMHELHDKSVAESIRMVGNIHRYAERQEKNSELLARQGRMASPKGAARMAVDTSAKILHTLNQLLKINGQILKLQSQQLAMANKGGKESTGHFRKINGDMRKSLKSFSQGLELPKF